jgi:hypothetical protein
MSSTAEIATLLQQFTALDASGAAKPDHPDHDRRSQLLDELQDAVGLGGRMVMDNDILKRAKKLVSGG